MKHLTACLALLISLSAAAQSIVNVSNTNFSCSPTNRMVLVTARTANVFVTLPVANAAGQELVVTVVDGTFNVTVQKNAADVAIVDPTNSVYMGGSSCGAGEAVSLLSDGQGRWYVTGGRNLGCTNWQGAPSSGGSNLPTATTAGQMLYYTGTKWATVAAGTSTQVLTGGSTPSWQTSSSSGVPTGGVIGFTSSAAVSGYTYTGLSLSSGGNTWSTKSSTGFTARNYATAASINGKVYVFGGWNGALVTKNEMYDPALDSWTAKSTTGMTARCTPAAVAANGLIYLIGGGTGPGNGALTTNEAYDPVSDSWTTKVAMPTARMDISGGGAVSGGIVYVCGGHNGTGGAPTRLSTLEAYDPVANSWSGKTAMPTARSSHSFVAANGLIYALGGFSSATNTWLNTNEAYDPSSNSWSTKSSTGFTANHAFGTVVSGSQIIVAGGFGNGSPTAAFSAVQAYDFIANSWSTVTATAVGYTPRYNTASAVAGGNLYMIGGDNGATYLTTNEAYVPTTTLYWFMKN